MKDLLQNVAEAAKEYSCNFGANKNLMRCIPVMNDGLKPGIRRLFWAWWLSEGKPSNTKPETLRKLSSSKVQTIASAAMAYHPHGETAMIERIATEGQTWNNNVMTIVPTGSYGNIRGDRHAAGRYIEAKLSEYAIDCFFDDFEIYKVPMKARYDGKAYEPEYLPSKYPHILFNPQFSSIGYSIASNIPSFNVGEVLKATIKLIKDHNAKVMLYPDLPTGCDIVDTGHFKDIMKTGVGKLTMKATYTINYDKNIITITSLPMQTSSEDVIKKIISIKNDKKKKYADQWVDNIYEIKDYTANDVVKLCLMLKPDANPMKVLEMLFQRKCDLKKTFPVGIKVIDDYTPYDYGVRDLLLEWIEFRRDTVRSRFNNELQQAEEQQHMNDVLIMVSDAKNVSDTIDIIKNSKNRQDSINRLMKRYNLTSLQAQTINDMRVGNLNREAHQRYLERRDEIKERIKEVQGYLNNDETLDGFIINQLEEGIKKYASPRKSKVVNDSEVEIEDTKHLIGLTTDGFIKKLNLDDHKNIGPIGKGNTKLTVMSCSNKDDILMIDTDGNAVRLSVSDVPDMDIRGNGVELVKFMKPGSSPTGNLVTIMKYPDDDEEKCLVIVTRDGYAKRLEMKELSNLKPGTSKSCISLGQSRDGYGFDSVVEALYTYGETTNDIIISTTRGNGLRLPLSDIKIYGKAAKGVRQIFLDDDEYVASASKIDPDKKLLLYVTSSGKCKVTELKYLPVREKRDQSVSLIPLEGKEILVGVSSCNKSDDVLIYRQNLEPVRVKISDIKITTRVAKPEKIIKTPKGEKVVAYRLFSK